MTRFTRLALAFAAVAAGAAGAAAKGSKKETKSSLKADLAQAQEHVVELTAELHATTRALNDARASREEAIEALETVSTAAGSLPAASSSSSGLPLLSSQQLLDISGAWQARLFEVADTALVRRAYAATSATANLGFKAASRGVEVTKKVGAKTFGAATAAVERALAHDRVAPLIARAQTYRVAGRPLTTVAAEAREVAGAVQAKAWHWLEIAKTRVEFACTVARFWAVERAMPVLAALSQPMRLSVARGSLVPSLKLVKFESDSTPSSEETEWVRVPLQRGAVDLFLGLLQCLLLSAGVVAGLRLALEMAASVFVQPLFALVGLALRLLLGAVMLFVASVQFIWHCYTAVLCCCCCRRRRRKAALGTPAKAAPAKASPAKASPAKAAPAKAAPAKAPTSPFDSSPTSPFDSCPSSSLKKKAGKAHSGNVKKANVPKV